MNHLRLAASCLFGLESVLSGEIKRLGGQNIQVSDGKVTFTGGLEMVAKANLWLRTAERVQIVLSSFRAESFEDLFQGVLAIPWEQFIGKSDAFPVKGWSLNSKLASVPDCQSIAKKAVVQHLEGKYGQSWFEETGPVHQIQFSILKDVVTVMLDTSGPGLHKRGYRQNTVEAPIKETLAAGIIDLARVYDDSIIIDPFCGSGTFLIEGIMHAMHIAPGINRRFAAERWDAIDSGIWRTARQEAMDLVRRDATVRAYGYDIDPAAVELTLANARKAGVISHVRARQQAVADFTCDLDKAVIFSNPPYGERLLEIKGAEEIYQTMGKTFPQKAGLRYYIISPHEEFERIFGRGADRRRKLYNGMIKCQLFMYFR